MSVGKRVENPVVNMIRLIQQQVLERLHQGKLRLPNDLNALQRHLKLAKELNHQNLIAELYDVLGSVYQDSGEFELAELAWLTAYLTFQQLDDQAGMATAQGNLGELYYHLNQLEPAQHAYEQARTCAEKIQYNQGIMMIESNLGLLWLEQGDYPQALICFALVLALTEKETWQHVHSLCNAHRGMAEIYLQEGNFAAAWREANEAHYLAEGRQLWGNLAKALFTKAHIAEHDPQSPQNALVFRKQAIHALESYPMLLARTCWHEARYYHRHHQNTHAAELGQLAHQQFSAQKCQRESDLVRQFLEQLP